MRRTFLILILLLFAPIVHAAVYHIDPTVSTSGTGTAASPFKSWSNLPSMSTGDDVYFKCGTTFQPTSRCLVSWGGTAENRAVIGAYYLSGGSPIYGVSGNRPILNGQTHTYPSRTSYHGMVHVIAQDYVTIQDLDITESGYYGISVSGDITNYPTSYTNAAYFVIQNCRVYSTYANSIVISNNSYNYGVIDGCEVGKGSEKSRLYGERITGSLTLASCNFAYTEIKNCIVYDSHGEGISTNRVVANATSEDSGYANIHHNLMYNNKQLSVYADASRYNEIHDNVIFGLGPDYIGAYTIAILDGRKWNGSGIVLNTENTRGTDPYPDPILADSLRYNKVYNNIIAGCRTGITLSSDHPPEEGGTLVMDGNEIYNNTLIGNGRNLNFGIKLANYTMSGNVVRNNISFCPSDSVSSINVATDYSWIDSKVTIDHNAWTGTRPIYTGDSATDVIINTNFEKTSGWQNLSGPIDAANAKLLAGSTAIEAGATIASLLTDYFGNTRTAPYDIGAHEYSATTGPEPPDPPSDSSCVGGTPTTDWTQATYNSTQGQSSWPRGVSGEVGVTGTLYGLKLSVASYTDPESTLTIRYKKNSNDLSTGATEQVVSITATGLLDIGLTTPLAVTAGDTLYIGWAETAGAIVLNVNSASVTADLTAVYGDGSGDWVLDQAEAKEHYIQTMICVPIESPSLACNTVTDIQTTAYATSTNQLDSTPRGQTVTLEPAYYKSMSLQLTATGAGSLTGRIGAEGTVDLSSGYLDEVVVAVPITASITRYKFEFSDPLWLDGQYAIGFIATSGTIVRYKADGDVYSGGNGIYGGGAGQWNMTGTSSMDWNVIFEKCETGETRRSRPSAILF